MPLVFSAQNRNLTVRLTGEIDHHAARQLMQELDREIEQTFPRQMTVDMSGVTFMDSSGIALILRTWRRMKEAGGTMNVIDVPQQAARVLKAAGVQKMVHMTFLSQRS